MRSLISYTAGRFDKQQAIRQAFSRAAQHYDNYAELQQQAGINLLSLINWQEPGCLLDIGSGSGWFSKQFREMGHKVIALDLAEGMLQRSKQLHAADIYLQADFQQLPLAANQLDYIWSNLALQWSSDLRLSLQQCLRVLKPQGRLAFSTLVEGSLEEVNIAWQPWDNRPHINNFLTFEQLQIAVQGFDIKLIQKTEYCYFSSVKAALWSLKGIGATYLDAGRRSGLSTRQLLNKLEHYWPCEPKGFRLTYQLVYGVTQ